MKLNPSLPCQFLPRVVIHEHVHDLPDRLFPVSTRCFGKPRPDVRPRELKQALAADQNSTRAQRSLLSAFVHYRRGTAVLNETGDLASQAVALPFAAVGAVLYGALGAPLAAYRGACYRTSGQSLLRSIGTELNSMALCGAVAFGGPAYLACKLGLFLLLTPTVAAVGLLLHAFGERNGLNAKLRGLSERQTAEEKTRDSTDVSTGGSAIDARIREAADAFGKSA